MKKTNPELIILIQELKAKKNKIWKALAKNLERSTRKKRIVNISKINKYTKNKDTVVVPGKVLSQGNLDHKVTVAAFQFSQAAKEKLKNTLTIQQLIKKNPKGKGVKIIC